MLVSIWFAASREATDKLGLPRIRFNRLTIEQDGNNTLISLGRDELAVLRNVEADTLRQRDFGQFVLSEA